MVVKQRVKLLPVAFKDEESKDNSYFRVRYNGEIIRAKRDTDTYIYTLEMIGLQRILDECSDLRVEGYDYPPVVTEEPIGTHWQTIAGLHVPTGKRGDFKPKMLRLIAEHLKLDLEVEDQKKGVYEQYPIRVTIPGNEPIERTGCGIVNDVVRFIGPRKVFESGIEYLGYPLVFQHGAKRPKRINCDYGIERDENNKPVLMIQTPGGSDTHMVILQKLKNTFVELKNMVIEALEP